LDAQATLQGDLAVKSPTFRAGRERLIGWGRRLRFDPGYSV